MILGHAEHLVGVTSILPAALQGSDGDQLAGERLLAPADRLLELGQRLRASICRDDMTSFLDPSGSAKAD